MVLKQTNKISYNMNTGLCVYNAKTQFKLRVAEGAFVNSLTEIGFKIKANTTATKALDVAGNILTSGSIIASSAVMNSVDIESGLSSLQPQVNGKQDLLTAGTNITIDGNNIISSSGGGGITQGDLDLNKTRQINNRNEYNN
jgi:hypothetical protein